MRPGRKKRARRPAAAGNPRPSASKGHRGDLYPAELRAALDRQDSLQLVTALTGFEKPFTTHGFCEREEILTVH